MSGEQAAADLQTKLSNQKRALEEELQSIRATLRVLIDGQAVMYADMIRHHSAGGAMLSEDDHLQLQNEWKEETAQLVRQILEGNNDPE